MVPAVADRVKKADAVAVLPTKVCRVVAAVVPAVVVAVDDDVIIIRFIFTHQ